MTSVTSLRGLMKHTVGLACSDLHLQAGLRPRIRLQGELVEVEGSGRVDEPALLAMLEELLPGGGKDRLARTGAVDFSVVDAGGTSWRGHAYRQRTGLSLALRPLAAKVPTLEELKLPPQLARLAEYRSGLVLITGATGTGKTSTLAALVGRIAAGEPRNVITIEDPIEYHHPPERSLVQQRAVGIHVPTFHQGVIDSLQEDPDVLLVGELRDLETVRAALTAAETGILVLATLHTNDAAQSVERILDLFEGDEQPLARVMLSHSLRAVVAQVLLDESTGKGRVPACEVMFQTPAVSGLIRAGRPHELRSLIQVSRAEGMILLDDALSELVRAGRVTAEEAARHAVDPQRFRREVMPTVRERPWWLGGPLRRAKAAAPTERRHEARVRALTLVNVGELDEVGAPRELHTGRTRDLSRDGMRLELDHPLLIGAHLRISLALENQVLELDGHVRSIARDDQGRYQVGVRFGRLDAEAAKALDGYLRLHA